MEQFRLAVNDEQKEKRLAKRRWIKDKIAF